MDEQLLAAARQAQEQLVEADHAAEVAKAQFHRAVRRLHLSGASLRELAAALHLSHQRVHQIVETAGGARRWGRRGRLPPELACSFCGRRQRKARELVAGPDVYICEMCVEMAETVIRSGQATELRLARCTVSPTTWRSGDAASAVSAATKSMDLPPASAIRVESLPMTRPSARSALSCAARSTPSS